MSQMSLLIDADDLIKERFSEAGVDVTSIERREYPDETIFVVYVDESYFALAADLGRQDGVGVAKPDAGVSGWPEVAIHAALQLIFSRLRHSLSGRFDQAHLRV